MLIKKQTLMTLTLLTYTVPSYGMLAQKLQLPSYELLDRMAQDNYKPTDKDIEKLVNIFIPFEQGKRPVDDLGKMAIAASAFIAFCNPSRDDKKLAMEDIKAIQEQAENAYHSQHKDNKDALDDEDKRQIAHMLYYSPYVYRDAQTTLFAETSAQHVLKKQFDEFAQRQELATYNAQLIKNLNSTIDTYMASAHDNSRSTVADAIHTKEPLTLFHLSARILEHNRELAVKRMESIAKINQSTVDELQKKVKTTQEKLKTAKPDEQEKVQAKLAEQKNELTTKQNELKQLNAELQAAQGGGLLSRIASGVFGFSGH